MPRYRNDRSWHAYVNNLMSQQKSGNRCTNASVRHFFFSLHEQSRYDGRVRFSADPRYLRPPVSATVDTRKTWFATAHNPRHTLTSRHAHGRRPSLAFRTKVTSNPGYCRARILESSSAAHAWKKHAAFVSQTVQEVARYGKATEFISEPNVRHHRVDKHGMIMVELRAVFPSWVHWLSLDVT